MPEMPATVQIGPYTYRVDQDRALLDDEHCLGQIRYQEARIVVHPDNHPTRMADVLLHEVLHGCLDLSHGNQRGAESFIERITAPLLDTLRRNPSLVAYLTGTADAA